MAFDDEAEKQILHHCFNCWPCDVDFVWRNPSCLLFSLSRVVFMQVLNWTTSCPFICWSIGSNPPIEIGREITRIIIHYLCPFLVRPICLFLSIFCLFCFHGMQIYKYSTYPYPCSCLSNYKSEIEEHSQGEVDLEFNPSEVL